ncbi:DUF559 domain-containing protein [Cryobacterium adonitolivorans]|uniref:DUF559 domain-containing protein n=1 Tax=Cryobacterium adonitolivorans TaxID=1259189 RepID=A0A4R8WFA9_9MICO|nr:DUF559 domain-containing protein [Cryobacterium adonitolivorans]TFC05493.1 DUF559 domain-containing protein [Cryobacterium adonitolivorans]
MSRRSELPRGLDLDGFTVAEARAAGVNRKRTRARDLEIPFRGVRAFAGSGAAVAGLARAYAARMPADHFFSHTTGALLLGLPLPRRLENDPRLHVSVLSPERALRMRGVVGHSVRGRPGLWIVNGLTMTDPVSTWCDLAALLGPDDLIAVGDHLLGKLAPPATMELLAAAVAARAGRRGVQRLRQALVWVRPRVESPRETRLRLLVVRAGFPEPDTNVDLPLPPGRRRARGDLVYLRYKILVEYDGEQHRTDDAQFARDLERLDDLAAAGWRVIRAAKGTRPAEILSRLDEALRARGWRP